MGRKNLKVKLSNKKLSILLVLVIVTTITIFAGYKLLKDESESQTVQVEGAFNFIVIFGVLFGIIKFASKVSLGCSFAHMNRLETATVATIYLCIPLIISLIIDALGTALGSTMTNLIDFNGIIGASQAIVSVILIGVGLYTVKKWTNSKKDNSKKTSIFMVFPCPGTLITIFTTAALLIIAGMDSLLVGLLIGGIFVSFIVIGGFIVVKSCKRRNPASFGGVMIFFGILYIFSVLFVPAYIPVSQMDIPVTSTPIVELLPGISFMIIAIIIGFIFAKLRFRKTIEVNR
jgi:predicted transporter